MHPAQPALLLLLLSLLLGGCATTGGGGFGGTQAENRALREARSGNYADAASAYIGLAAQAEGIERDRLTLLAVEQWLRAGDRARAVNAMRAVPVAPAANLEALWTVNTSALLLADNRVEEAIALLEPLSRSPLSQSDRARVDAARADAWIAREEPERAVQLMAQRETWLDSGGEILDSRRRLWDGLKTTHPIVLREAANVTTDTEVQGWLTLASLARTTGEQGIGWSNGLVRWRDQYPGHPAITIISGLDEADEILLEYPRRIALLLPLSGRTASAGLAIQNGFMGAYFATAGGLDDRQTVRVYDVEGEGGAVAAYEAAVSDGAEFVVGPLLRSSVSELANGVLLPVPVLALNNLPDESMAPPGLFQFALSPEDEAVSAAERAIAEGHTRALALVPNSSWGRRVLSAFIQHFESLGGTVLDYRQYTTGNPDYSGAIEDLMALSGSVRRYTRMRAIVGGPLQFDPRRREDAQLIFLGADADNGRLLKSQLKFHYSGDLPVFATSSVNSLDGRSNSDLNGVGFADAPWVVEPQGWIEYLPDLFNEYWPQQRRLSRLHAMGYDAYQLVAPLHASRDGRMAALAGATGLLTLDVDGRLHRSLAWAEFVDGAATPKPLDTGAVPPMIDIDDTEEAEAGDPLTWPQQDL
ncbi:MAG: penicillin-binding protein activator [Pseudomonadota bacterium]